MVARLHPNAPSMVVHESPDFSMDVAAAWAGKRRVGRIGIVVWRGLRGRREQLARSGDVLSASAAGEQAVAANAMEAARQDVNEKAADEDTQAFWEAQEREGPIALVPGDADDEPF
jgi:hypothetical protein